MVCEHLAMLEKALLEAGVRESFRGKAWSDNCREWVYFNCVLDRSSLRARMTFAASVQDHEHLGTHDGQEAGFVCTACHDAIMGMHPKAAPNANVFR